MRDGFGTLLMDMAMAVRLEFHSPFSNASAMSLVDMSAERAFVAVATRGGSGRGCASAMIEVAVRTRQARSSERVICALTNGCGVRCPASRAGLQKSARLITL